MIDVNSVVSAIVGTLAGSTVTGLASYVQFGKIVARVEAKQEELDKAKVRMEEHLSDHTLHQCTTQTERINRLESRMMNGAAR